jgi:hypothetical protein
LKITIVARRCKMIIHFRTMSINRIVLKMHGLSKNDFTVVHARNLTNDTVQAPFGTGSWHARTVFSKSISSQTVFFPLLYLFVLDHLLETENRILLVWLAWK